MSGLYIHIPFCKSRCIYCGFYSTTNERFRQQYVDALCRELALRKGYVEGPWHTVYIGGGTPSQLSASELCQLFSAIDCSKAVEVTMECNPDDITPDYAAVIASLPINRVSMGAQTFNDERLHFLHRRHTSSEVESAINILRRAGINNISIDLMYGFPDETLDDWKEDIRRAVCLGVEHLSAYSLMFEEGTPLYRLLEKGKVDEADEELSREMFYLLSDRMKSAGYEHYEISNFARPGYRSRHNSSYWQHVPYLGIGASAHSFDGNSRQWNVADLCQYIESVKEGKPQYERETLDADTLYDEVVMLSLRTAEGIDLNKLAGRFGVERLNYCMDNAQKYIVNGLLEQTIDNHLRLTRQGFFVSDMVMSDLMNDR